MSNNTNIQKARKRKMKRNLIYGGIGTTIALLGILAVITLSGMSISGLNTSYPNTLPQKMSFVDYYNQYGVGGKWSSVYPTSLLPYETDVVVQGGSVKGLMTSTLTYHSGDTYWFKYINSSYPYTSMMFLTSYMDYSGQSLTAWDRMWINNQYMKTIYLTKMDVGTKMDIIKPFYVGGGNNSYLSNAAAYNMTYYNFRFDGSLQVRIQVDKSQFGNSWYNPSSSDANPAKSTFIVILCNATSSSTNYQPFTINGFKMYSSSSVLFYYAQLNTLSRFDLGYINKGGYCPYISFPVNMQGTATAKLKLTVYVYSDISESQLLSGTYNPSVTGGNAQQISISATSAFYFFNK